MISPHKFNLISFLYIIVILTKAQFFTINSQFGYKIKSKNKVIKEYFTTVNRGRVKVQNTCSHQLSSK